MELRVDFESKNEWDFWKKEQEPNFATWKNKIIAEIKQSGFFEPVTGLHVDHQKIKISDGNYRESISYNELNSRKRALLLEFDLMRRTSATLGARAARIFAPEALSRTALILRGLYPYFLGTEYIPDLDKKLRYYPVQHADLLHLDMPDRIFDAIMTGDVLEHVTDLGQVIREMSRVLRPGGALISTFPFDTDLSETDVAARIEDGQIVHLRKAEYHGDPLDLQDVLVFQVPGWDILDMCKDAGLTDARMVLHASAQHGIVADSTPGVFVLSAIKSGSKSVRPRLNWIWNAARINRVVGILGLPRSGTTMFTAVLDAHADIVSIYEPWNANAAAISAGRLTITTESLIAEAEAQSGVAHTLIIKETTASSAYAANLAAVLSQATAPISRHLLILIRNPFHCFLSEIEGRQKWWGEQGLEISEEVFDKWARRTIASFQQLLHLATMHPSTFVFYEACVSRPKDTFAMVMQKLDLQFTESQLRITENTDIRKIRGDLSLVENTRDVADVSVAKRTMEFELMHTKFAESQLFETIEGLRKLFEQLQIHNVIGYQDADRSSFEADFKKLIAEPLSSRPKNPIPHAEC